MLASADMLVRACSPVRLQRLDGAFEGFRTAVNQGPVPMHEQLRTELRNLELAAGWKQETGFWRDSGDSDDGAAGLLTKDDGNDEEDVQQHRREMGSAVRAPVGKLCATINASREHGLAEFYFA